MKNNIELIDNLNKKLNESLDFIEELKELKELNKAEIDDLKDHIMKLNSADKMYKYLKEKYRWKKQSEEPAPEYVFVEMAYKKDSHDDTYDISLFPGKYVFKDAYWRYSDLDSLKNK